jgi:hypothetical protein
VEKRVDFFSKIFFYLWGSFSEVFRLFREREFLWVGGKLLNVDFLENLWGNSKNISYIYFITGLREKGLIMTLKLQIQFPFPIFWKITTLQTINEKFQLLQNLLQSLKSHKQPKSISLTPEN